MSHCIRFVYVWGRLMNCRRLIEIEISLDHLGIHRQSICKLIRRSILLKVLDKKHCRLSKEKTEKKIKRMRLWNISGDAFSQWTMKYWSSPLNSYDASTMIYCYRSKQLAHFWNCMWNEYDWIKQFPNVIKGLIYELLHTESTTVTIPCFNIKSGFDTRSYMEVYFDTRSYTFQRLIYARPRKKTFYRLVDGTTVNGNGNFPNSSCRSKNKLSRTLARWSPNRNLSRKPRGGSRRKRFSWIVYSISGYWVNPLILDKSRNYDGGDVPRKEKHFVQLRSCSNRSTLYR